MLHMHTLICMMSKINNECIYLMIHEINDIWMDTNEPICITTHGKWTCMPNIDGWMNIKIKLINHNKMYERCQKIRTW